MGCPENRTPYMSHVSRSNQSAFPYNGVREATTGSVSGTGTCLTTDGTATATNMSNAVVSFLNYRGLTANLVMFGETWSNAPDNPSPPNGASCDGGTQVLAQQGVSGFLSSTLYTQFGSNAVLRPWETTTSRTSTGAAACQTPASIGAPTGPYTP